MANRISTAFNEQENLVGLSLFVGASILLLNPIPLLIGAALEAGYLLFVPDSEWYSKKLEKRQKSLIKENRLKLKQKVYHQASNEFCIKYDALESVRTQLDDDYASKPDWRDVIDRLDTLLGKYLEFGYQDARLRQYICQLSEQAKESLSKEEKVKIKESNKNFTDPTVKWVEAELSVIRYYFKDQIVSIQKLIDEELERQSGSLMSNDSNVSTLRKRIDIQSMMLSQAEKIGSALVNLNQQMALMEETIRLINGQINSKQPGQVLFDIETLVNQSEGISNFINEITPFEENMTEQLLIGNRS